MKPANRSKRPPPRPSPHPPFVRAAAAGIAMFASGHAPAAPSPAAPTATATVGVTPGAKIESKPAPSPAVAATAAPVPAAWPKDFQLTIAFDIGAPSVPAKAYRPYVAFWIQDAEGYLVRTLGVLGNDSRFNSHLTGWRRAGGYFVYNSPVTRATRPSGIYTLTWDGRDDYGLPLPKGTYTVWVELVREEGRHTQTSATIVCDDAPHSVELAATVESGASKITYGPKPTTPSASVAVTQAVAPAVPPAFPSRP